MVVFISSNQDSIKITTLQKEQSSFIEESSGVSFLIQKDNLNILLDTSYSDDILEYVKDITMDYLILSHGHLDHTEGLKFLKNVKNIVTHPLTFQERFDEEEKSIGIPIKKEELKTNLILSKKPFWINKDIVFLGEIPRKNDFEGKAPECFLDKEQTKPDFVLDDSALVIKSKKGLIVITGCSHSGICNIIDYAKEICKEKVYAVIGGFHLFNKDLTDRTISWIKEQNINEIYTCHCFSDYAFKEFEKIGAKRLKTLQEIDF